MNIRVSHDVVVNNLPDRKGFKAEKYWLEMDYLWTALNLDLKEIIRDGAVEELKKRAADVAATCRTVMEAEGTKLENYMNNDAGMTNLEMYLEKAKSDNEREVMKIYYPAIYLIEHAEEVIRDGVDGNCGKS